MRGSESQIAGSVPAPIDGDALGCLGRTVPHAVWLMAASAPLRSSRAVSLRAALGQAFCVGGGVGLAQDAPLR
jgi:hypothetical protein